MRVFVLFSLAMLLAGATPAWGADPEYDSHCAYGMSEGTAISTACQIVWLSPEGKIYCFLNRLPRKNSCRRRRRI